jgi:hypothetical protein
VQGVGQVSGSGDTEARLHVRVGVQTLVL